MFTVYVNVIVFFCIVFWRQNEKRFKLSSFNSISLPEHRKTNINESVKTSKKINKSPKISTGNDVVQKNNLQNEPISLQRGRKRKPSPPYPSVHQFSFQLADQRTEQPDDSRLTKPRKSKQMLETRGQSATTKRTRTHPSERNYRSLSSRDR